MARAPDLWVAVQVSKDLRTTSSAALPMKVRRTSAFVASPAIDAASLWIADEKGHFKKHGLQVELTAAGSGPGSGAAASVVSNATQFGLAANVAILTARSHNVPLVVAAPSAGNGTASQKSKDELLVRADSAVKSFADLPGQTVVVVAVKNSPELFIRELVDEAGGDSTKVKFVEMPFAQMDSALDSGRVAAIAVSEPFLSLALDKGNARSLGSYVHDALGDDTGYTYWFTNKKFAASNAQGLRIPERAGRGGSVRRRSAITDDELLPAAPEAHLQGRSGQVEHPSGVHGLGVRPPPTPSGCSGACPDLRTSCSAVLKDSCTSTSTPSARSSRKRSGAASPEYTNNSPFQSSRKLTAPSWI